MIQRIFQVKTTSEDTALRGQLLKGTALMMFVSGLLVLVLGLQTSENISEWWTAGGVMLFSMVVFGLAHQGYVRAGGVLLGAMLLLAIGATQNTGQLVATRVSMATLLPTLVVGLVVSSNAMLIFGVLTLGARVVAQTALNSVEPQIIVNDFIVIIVCLAITWLIFRTLERGMQRSNLRAEAALKAQRELSAQQLAIHSKNVELEASNTQMAALLDLVRDLETPVMPLLDGVLVLPLVGHVDTQRASRLTEAALAAVHSQRAKVVLIDITGVSVVDTAIAQRISHLAHAIRLLGARVLLTGIRADIAHTIVAQGIDFSHIQTAGRLQDGLATVLESLNRPVVVAAANGRAN